MHKTVSAVTHLVTDRGIPVTGVVMKYPSLGECEAAVHRDHLAEAVETLDMDTPNEGARQSLLLLKTLLYLGLERPDDAHRLVTPLSYEAYTEFGGAPVTPVLDIFRSDACLLHAWVHRMEGPHVGEFGTGWNNAAFWFSRTRLSAPLADHPGHPQSAWEAAEWARDARCKVSGNSQGATDHPLLGMWGKSHNPSAVLKACEAAVKDRDAERCKRLANGLVEEWKGAAEYLSARWGSDGYVSP
eukprot:TRINITY_DN40961_c0_g1_i1.p1 TRINITY_DN40961_c0_g1~~TRINITY_DN40961_c0_g1_i1.p1  ORF type:complete len:243 (-),score=20.81 TRINITY_DN40961_c0_g1_i1:98-826(-)